MMLTRAHQLTAPFYFYFAGDSPDLFFATAGRMRGNGEIPLQ